MPLRVAEMLTKVRRALASRYLFDNWFSLLIRDILTRLGFNVRLVARVGDCTFELSPGTFEILVSRFSRASIKSIGCVNGRLLVNGVEVSRIDDVIRDTKTWAKVLGWDYDTVNGFWFKGNAKFRHMYWLIIEIFHYGVYESLGVEGRVVVDVGAFIGDSAIYFALKGAKRVIAIEPHPGAFAEMLDNIKLNNMEGVIVPVNAGLASRPGKVCIENVNTSNTFVIYHRPGDCPNAIPAVTLSELISRFSINVDDAVLKMDCEGCEFDVILNDYEHVRLFRELILEYHPKHVNKPVGDLLNVLSRDYKCDVRGNENSGIMHCIRK
jgi:FkbM family methyltransferase